MSLIIKVEFASFWHVGTGKGAGAGADACLARCELGLPYVPGRHLKGLLRHSLRFVEEQGLLADAGNIDMTFTDLLFGRASGDPSTDAKQEQAGAYRTVPGLLQFGSACLPLAWRDYARTEKGRNECAALVGTVQSTALGDDGVVKAMTLRSIEVAVPVTLFSRVSSSRELSNDERRALDLAAMGVRAVGGNRTRGLGRADVTIEEVS